MAWQKQLTFWSCLVLIGLTIPLILFEFLLRVLPVCDATHRLPVNEGNPILRFEPNRQLVWSKGWNFSIVNELRTNNFGFLSQIDYDKDATTPLLAIVGDSYVEAVMVPFKETAAGRLADQLGDQARAYSFGVSGAPLSQYLAYSEFVRNTFQPAAMIIVIVGNDFDESLKKYKSKPGYHYFFENSNGELRLERMDYSPPFWKRFFRESTLFRYLAINLGLQARLQRFNTLLSPKEEYVQFVGNTSSSSSPTRIADSKLAIHAFLNMLPATSGLSPNQIVFVIDGRRPHLYEDSHLKLTESSYFSVMRRYFIENATAIGYETIDMEPIFRDHYKQHGRRFEYPDDGHWNSLGHALCFEAITDSRVFIRFTNTM